MRRKSAAIGLAVLFGGVIALGYAGWTIYRNSRTEYCEFSARPVHSMTKAVAWLDGEKKIFCCPTCAVTARAQGGKALQFLELTDYETGKTLAPADAFLVRGSEVNLCVRQHMLEEPNKQAAPMEFDRCMPSIVAFARREAAEQFLQEHGGTLLSLQQLVNPSGP